MKSLDHEAQQRLLEHTKQRAAGVLHPPITHWRPEAMRAARELLRMKPAR